MKKIMLSLLMIGSSFFGSYVLGAEINTGEINAGVDVAQINRLTPLYIAAEYGDIQIIRAILEVGPNNIVNNNVPLYQARSLSHVNTHKKCGGR